MVGYQKNCNTNQITDLGVFMSIQEGANMVQMTEERKETRNMMQTTLLPFIDMPKELHRKHVSM